jgi:hypothetical protein
MNLSEEVVEILFDGSWSISDVSILETTSSRIISDEIEELAQKSWETSLFQAKKRGQKIWDSLIYRFEDSQVKNETLRLSVSTIKYSTRVGMNKLTDYVQSLGYSYAPRGMFSSCLVRTKEGKYIFIKKSNKYWTDKKMSWVGGVFSQNEVSLTHGEDLFKAVKNEINEEIGVPHEYLEGIKLHFGFLTRNWNVCLLFKINLALTIDEIENYYNKYSDNEASEILFVDKNLTEIWKEMPPCDKVKFEIFKNNNLL